MDKFCNINNAPNDSDEVKCIPRIFEVVLKIREFIAEYLMNILTLHDRVQTMQWPDNRYPVKITFITLIALNGWKSAQLNNEWLEMIFEHY